MSKASNVIALGIRKLWTAVAVLLVIVALFISFLRYSLPMLDDRKHVIEGYVLTEYGIDLSIGSVSADWKSTGPSLQFNDVHLRQGDQSPISLKVGDVYLAVEFWSSVFSGKLQSRNVSLSDLHITLDVQRIESGATDFPIVTALETIFLEQLSNFSVSSSELTLLNNDNQNTIRIRQLSWLNRGNRHQGLGELTLEGFASNTASFVLDLQGNVDSYNGTLYAKGRDLDISPWIDEFTALDSDLVTSKGNFAVWADIAQGKFTDIRAQLLPSQFDWTTTASKRIETEISAEFAGTPSVQNGASQSWAFVINNLAISTNENSIISNWKGRFSEGQGLELHNEEPLNLDSLLPLSALLDDEASLKIAAMQPNIELASVYVKANTDGLRIVSQNNRLAWLAHENTPGIDELRLDIYWSGKNGVFRLHGENAELQSNALFERNLRMDKLDMRLQFMNVNDAWSVSSLVSDVQIDGLILNPSISYSSANQVLSILTEVQKFPLSKIPSLLPNNYMSSDAKTYLSNAFVGEGEVTDAHVLWHGKASDFPFDDQSGTFQASVKIADADFDFSDRWPALNRLNIDLLFENQSLLMRADTGQLAGVELSNLHAEIPSLSNNATLTILADGKSDGEAVAQLMQQSSLSETLGRVLSQDVVVTGPVNTNLNLYIPLSDPSNTRAVGTATLIESDVRITALGIDFQRAKGVINFDNDRLNIAGLEASLLEQAVSIDLLGQRENLSYQLDIGIQGSWLVDNLIGRYAPELDRYLAGEADWILDLDVMLQDKDYTYTAELQSTLDKVSSQLPAPLQKQSEQALPLSINASGNNIASEITLQLDRDVRFEGILPHKERQFSRAHLALGQTDFVGMGVGFSISANLPFIDTEKWVASVAALVGGLQQSERSILSSPERIFAQADQLLLAGTRITDVNVTAKRLDRDWLLEIDADQMRGTADISSDWVSKGVRIDADYIKLNDIDFSVAATQAEREIDPKTMPNIKFNCAACEIANIDLGRVTLEAEPNNDGLEITRLLIESENGTINALGQWYQRHSDHYTFIAGDLLSDDFGRLLSNFGLDSGVKDSEANIDFALTWKDSPMDFGFEQLDGQIEWSLTDGYLTEVSDKGSRIFTLLSLNSLVRKLSLDFRDVFAKGFFYDDMKGSIQITDGKADTRDTAIDGAAGDIEIYGYTDLVSKELNYNVSFTPNVTGNLPVLVYFFTVSPPSALAALAIDQVLTSAKVISNVNYSVSGTIDDPVLIETGRQSTEVELPTRRDLFEEKEPLEFLPPTVDDLLPLESNSE
ncbi:YhdP family protein [Glaciecola sp. SC05]|uniref:YhdP family protein n=1 Tax=Glaciecola sp. SC05 TaxID=1987355 RepID=UPI003528E762